MARVIVIHLSHFIGLMVTFSLHIQSLGRDYLFSLESNTAYMNMYYSSLKRLISCLLLFLTFQFYHRVNQVCIGVFLSPQRFLYAQTGENAWYI